jgi:choline kinase
VGYVSRDRNKTVAIVLAAGVGRRLGDLHDGPKVLLDFAGRTLLERRLRALAACGVREVCITVGYEAEAVRAEAHRVAPDMTLRFVENPRFREGSLVSLAVQVEALISGRPVLLMDGDVLHDSRMVERLLTDAGREATLLFDPVLEPGDEPVKICLRGDAIVDFRKVPVDPGERHGESVGFFRFGPAMAMRLADRCAARLAAGQGHLEYEEAIRDLILADPGAFGIEDVGDLPWTEIDFPQDVTRARDHVLPQLKD